MAEYRSSLNRTGNIAPTVVLQQYDERLTEIFGEYGIGLAVIPEVGVENTSSCIKCENEERYILFLFNCKLKSSRLAPFPFQKSRARARAHAFLGRIRLRPLVWWGVDSAVVEARLLVRLVCCFGAPNAPIQSRVSFVVGIFWETRNESPQPYESFPGCENPRSASST